MNQQRWVVELALQVADQEFGPSFPRAGFRTVSERYVNSNTRSEEIRQMVDQGANTRKYGVNAFVPLGLQIPAAKDFVLHLVRLGPWPLPSWIAVLFPLDFDVSRSDLADTCEHGWRR
jgi:hypothetical protein